MADPELAVPDAADGPGRLDGWKEIAVYLGKGVRSAQRWEKQYGLPVRRLGREGGEIVFAYRHELDAWRDRMARGLADDETGPVEPGPTVPAGPVGVAPGRRARPWLVGVAGLALLLGAAALLARRSAPEADRPDLDAAATWRVGGHSFALLDARERVVFQHEFTFPLSDASGRVNGAGDRRVQVVDIDGDGATEVLLAVLAEAREERRLYCFESDGRVRFVHQPRGSRRYGETVYSEPWVAHRVFATKGPDGRPSVWAVFTHGAWFPTRVQALSPRGEELAEYDSAGFVESVREVVWQGRPVVLVGGADNAHRGAGLAVIDRAAFGGHAPAVKPQYACADCPAGRPLEYLVFPSSCLKRLEAGVPAVLDAWVEGGERLNVLIAQGSAAPEDGIVQSQGSVTSFYSLGAQLAPVHVEISREFQALHAAREKRGLVDHPFGEQDDREAFPVLRFDGVAFVELSRVPVTH
jgi:hypothetical protein